MVRHLGLCLFGFGKVMSERAHLKVSYFYILWHFTLIRGPGATKGVLEGYGDLPI